LRQNRKTKYSTLSKPPRSKRGGFKPLDTPFGMGVYMTRFAPAQWPLLAERLQNAGVQWSREDVPWSLVEPEPGRFDFKAMDALVDFLSGLNIRVYGILHGSVAWANPAWRHVDAFAEYVHQTVRHFRGRVEYWEIWNEPNRANFWNDAPNPDEYHALLKSAYEAAKRANPACRILLGSMACLDVIYLRRLFELGAGSYYDLMNIHPYRLLASVESRDLVMDLERLNALCAAYGCLKPTWLTELGWPTGAHLAVSEQTQAEYLVKAHVMALSVPGLEKFFWYNFQDDRADPAYWEWNLGVLRHDLSPKPAYRAFAAMTRLLQGLDYLGPIDLSGASQETPLDVSKIPLPAYLDGDDVVLDALLSDEPGQERVEFPVCCPLPGEPTGLAMDVHADASDNLLGVRIRDARGREVAGDLDYLNIRGWSAVAGAFPVDASVETGHASGLTYPLTLVSLYVRRYPFRRFYLHEGDGFRCRIRLRNVRAVTRPRGFLFGKGRRCVGVLWRPCGVQEAALPFRSISGGMQGFDLYGQAAPIQDQASATLSPAPQYVLFETG
jgi:hypothetical protein